MDTNYIYVTLKINRNNGEIEMVKEKQKNKKIKEIERFYKKIGINNFDYMNSETNFNKNISPYNSNKKSKLDDKTSVRIGSNYYGGLV